MIKVRMNRQAFQIALAKRNLSQREFAAKIGFSRSHLSFILSGKREPSPALRRLILENLKEYQFDDLFIIEEAKNGD
jgi:putative transcriptional regulator